MYPAAYGGRETAELTYDAYAEMAQKELANLESQARERWGLLNVSLCIALVRCRWARPVSPLWWQVHRRAAFEAGEWLIDTLKQCVPIWKQEHWADGTSEWVHPHKCSMDESPGIAFPG